jgi:aminoglycoside phosphotransferase (APT) family kinase protein
VTETGNLASIPWRRDPMEIGPRLRDWARQRFEPGAELTDLTPPDGNGYSSETVLFSIHHRGGEERLVARLAPMPEVYPVFPEYDLSKQRKCMDLVRAATDVPVPEVTHLEDDTSFVGTPFLVMRRVDGAVPTDTPPYCIAGWVPELSAEDRDRMQDNAAGVLARLHELTPDRYDLSFLATPEHGSTPLAQELGYQRYYYEWAREGLRYPLIERTFAWLDAHLPDEGPPVLNWGDARIGNMLWRGVEPAAVLDWEMAAVGPPEVDLAWMIFLNRFFQEMVQRYGLPGLPGFMDRADMIASYERQSGRVVRALDWFEVFGALRFAIVSVRTTARSVAYGQTPAPADPDDVIMFRPLLEQMLDGTYWH